MMIWPGSAVLAGFLLLTTGTVQAAERPSKLVIGLLPTELAPTAI